MAALASTLHPIKIAIVGPESSGKTTLAQDIATTLSYTVVPEYAREYFAHKKTLRYGIHDIIEIAKGQLAVENVTSLPAVCDTTLLVCKIWAEVRFGHCPNWINDHYLPHSYTHHFLTSPDDIPWEPDPLRENPHNRDWLFTLYQKALESTQSSYTIIRGSREERLKKALEIIHRIMHFRQ